MDTKFVKIGKAKSTYLPTGTFKNRSTAVWKMGNIYVARSPRPGGPLKHIIEYTEDMVFIDKYSGDVFVKRGAL